jgi:hypothetical protein
MQFSSNGSYSSAAAEKRNRLHQLDAAGFFVQI